MKTEFIGYIIPNIFVIIFLISIGEIFARYYLGLGTPPLSISDPKIEYMFKPNQDIYRFGNHFITNEYGMRSEPFAKKKSSNELRLMVFGDSVVNGGNLTDHAKLATSILKEKLTKILDKNIVVGNISAGSWGPGNWLAYAKEYGFFDADIIILVISSHDYIDNPTFQPLDKNTHPTKQPVSALLEGIERYLPRYFSPSSTSTISTEHNQYIPEETLVSRIFRAGSKTKNRPLLHKGFRKPQSVARINKDTNEETEVQKGLGDLKKFLELAKNNSNNVCVFQHYEKSEIESHYPQIGNKLIKEICNQLGIIPTSLEPCFRQSIEDGLNPYHDEIHPNNIGQKLIAEAIFAKINMNIQ